MRRDAWEGGEGETKEEKKNRERKPSNNKTAIRKQRKKKRERKKLYHSKKRAVSRVADYSPPLYPPASPPLLSSPLTVFCLVLPTRLLSSLRFPFVMSSRRLCAVFFSLSFPHSFPLFFLLPMQPTSRMHVFGVLLATLRNGI